MILGTAHRILMSLAALFLAITLLYSSGTQAPGGLVTADADVDSSVEFTVVIDAGHGGMDGGAVSADGITLEKDLNLSVAGMLCDMLTSAGIKTVMTRTDDRMLGDGDTDRKKQEDLDARLDVCNSYPNAVFVSIHMNSFPQVRSCRGVQIWYSPNSPESSALAESVRAVTKELLQPDNTRRSKPAGSNIYLLKKLECPAILCECGFLSNPEEACLLTNEEYQRRLAFVIFGGITGYLNGGSEYS